MNTFSFPTSELPASGYVGHPIDSELSARHTSSPLRLYYMTYYYVRQGN